MENLLYVASYLYNRYFDAFGFPIEEMKLHKLLYLAQRESFIQRQEPLFDAVFYGWKFGPILKEIRSIYQDNSFSPSVPSDVVDRITPIMDKVFLRYAGKDSVSLSRLTRGEYAWKNSRIGIPDGKNSDLPMKLEDIGIDAERIRQRRKMLSRLGLCQKM